MIANPAAEYCVFLGYDYRIVDTARGQQGICTFPDGTSCDEWQFFAGKCGQEHSYCARQGYGIKTLADGQDPFSQEYAVCLDAAGNVLGSVAELSGLLDHLGCKP